MKMSLWLVVGFVTANLDETKKEESGICLRDKREFYFSWP